MYVRAHTYVREINVPLMALKDNLYPVGHLSLHCSEDIAEICEISEHQNGASINAFLICLLPQPIMCRHPSAWNCDRKYTTFF